MFQEIEETTILQKLNFVDSCQLHQRRNFTSHESAKDRIERMENSLSGQDPEAEDFYRLRIEKLKRLIEQEVACCPLLPDY